MDYNYKDIVLICLENVRNSQIGEKMWKYSFTGNEKIKLLLFRDFKIRT